MQSALRPVEQHSACPPCQFWHEQAPPRSAGPQQRQQWPLAKQRRPQCTAHALTEESLRMLAVYNGVKEGERRVEVLLGSGTGHWSDFLEESELILEVLPQAGVVVMLLLSGLTTATTLALCSALQLPPTGGMHWSLEGLQHAGQGAGAAVPFALALAGGWTGEAPSLLRRLQVAWQQQRLTSFQALLVQHLPAPQAELGALVWRLSWSTFLLLVLYQGTERLVGLCLQPLAQLGAPLGVHTPHSLLSLIPQAVAIMLCARVNSNITTEEARNHFTERLKVLLKALRNSTQYYSFTASGPDPSSADIMSMGFSAGAGLWVTAQAVSLVLDWALAFMYTALLCLLWKATGDIAAPLGAELMICATQSLGLRTAVRRRLGDSPAK